MLKFDLSISQAVYLCVITRMPVWAWVLNYWLI